MILSPYNAPTRIVETVVGRPGSRRVVCEPPRKKVAIVAFAQTSTAVVHVQKNPDWEIWGLNNGFNLETFYDDEQRFRADRWFEMHPIRVQPRRDFEWLHVCPVPIYILDLNDPHPNGYSPNAVQFPLAACEALVPLSEPFWACTFSYQIALAILEGFSEIALMGIDCGTPREWLFERANVLFWAGLAAGRGIRISCPELSSLFQHGGRYGYDYEDEVNWCQQGIETLMGVWGYVERPEAKARRLEQERWIQEAIAK